MLKVSLLTSTVLKAQMKLENKAASDSKPCGCAVFSRRDHQIIRLIFLRACSGDSVKQVFPIWAPWQRHLRGKQRASQCDQFGCLSSYYLIEISSILQPWRWTDKCRRQLPTSFPGPELNCVIQVKSGYWDRSGFLGDTGGSVIFEIAKKEKNLMMTGLGALFDPQLKLRMCLLDCWGVTSSQWAEWHFLTAPRIPQASLAGLSHTSSG